MNETDIVLRSQNNKSAEGKAQSAALNILYQGVIFQKSQIFFFLSICNLDPHPYHLSQWPPTLPQAYTASHVDRGCFVEL